MQNISIYIAKIISFFKTDIWRINLNQVSKTKASILKFLLLIMGGVRGFIHDKCQLRASALTFYSLLSIVPVVAMAFGIAKGFGFEKLLEKELYRNFPGQQEVIENVVTFAISLLEKTKGGVVAGVGVAILFWMVIKVLSNIEESFNAIWEIKESRAWGRKFSDYLSIMLICPVLVITSNSLTVFITSQIMIITEKISLLGAISPFIFLFLKLAPFFLIWVVFSMIYILMPNTKVNYSSGIIAGVIIGTIYLIVQWAYIKFQIGVTQYNAIYGSFAALPLFLVWLQLSWFLLLFGAELSYAHQNIDSLQYAPECETISFSLKKIFGLMITHLLICNFTKGLRPLNDKEISDELSIPIKVVRKILDELVESQIISKIFTKNLNKKAYQPARDISKITVGNIIKMFEEHGSNEIPIPDTKAYNALVTGINEFEKQIEQSPSNKLLKDI
ncbi:MAG: YihY family inner membrane protein [Desulfobacterales bacterium]|nr:YihY family inner membrane protein [Desulfobacterales bacterium]